MLRASLARDGKTSLATIAGRSHMPTSYISISFASTLILVLGDCASATKAQKAAADPEETSPSAVQQPRVQTTTQQVVICTQTAEGTKSKAAAQGLTTAARELAKLKAKVMAADYRANLEELARLREELSPWRKDNEVGYLAYYWSGFASWRIAINGANHQMKEEDLTTNLRKATTDLYSAMRLKDDFADTYAAAALVNSWLAMMVDRDERLHWLGHYSRTVPLSIPRTRGCSGRRGHFSSTRRNSTEEASRARSRFISKCSRWPSEGASTRSRRVPIGASPRR